MEVDGFWKQGFISYEKETGKDSSFLVSFWVLCLDLTTEDECCHMNTKKAE